MGVVGGGWWVAGGERTTAAMLGARRFVTRVLGETWYVLVSLKGTAEFGEGVSIGVDMPLVRVPCGEEVVANIVAEMCETAERQVTDRLVALGNNMFRVDANGSVVLTFGGTHAMKELQDALADELYEVDVPEGDQPLVNAIVAVECLQNLVAYQL